MLAIATSLAAQQPTGSLTGRVVDSYRSPLAGVLVFLGDGPGASVRTDAGGSFRFEGVGPGADRIGFLGSGLAPRSVPWDGRARDLGEIVLERGADPTVTVTGRVTDARDGTSVEGAEILLGEGARVVSDENGVFRLRNARAAWGPNLLTVRHLAHDEATAELWIAEHGAELSASFSLDPAPVQLGGLVVQGSPSLRAPGARQGFHARRRSTNGYFLERTEIEARNPSGLGSLLRGAAGLRFYAAPEGTEIVFSRRTVSFDLERRCRSPLIYVDGILVEADTQGYVEIDELVSPEDLAGVEVYNGAARIPTAFNTTGSACGVIALWTGADLAAPVADPTIAVDVGSSRTGRKLLIGAVAVPLVYFALKSAICSMPHYCR